MESLRHTKNGFTFIELLASSVIVAVTAGGTLMAFVAAARMMTGRENPTLLEAAGYAQQMVEGMRNRVATDDLFLTTAPPIWINAALAPPPSNFPDPPSPGTNSIYTTSPLVKRCYRITQVDCDGLSGTPEACPEVQSQVCWGDDLTGCSCP